MSNETAMQPVEMPTGQVAGFRDVDSSRGSYIAFPSSAGSNSLARVKAKIPDCEEFEPILTRQNRLGDEYVRIADDNLNFRCIFIGGFHCFADLDISTGVPNRAALSDTEGMVELVEAVVIVDIGKNEFELTRVSFRRALAKAGLQMYNAQTVQAIDPEWIKSVPHVAKVPPQFRHYHTIAVSQRASRRLPGKVYPAADATCNAATPEQLSALQAYLDSPAFTEEYPLVMARYSARIAEIQAKLPK